MSFKNTPKLNTHFGIGLLVIVFLGFLLPSIGLAQNTNAPLIELNMSQQGEADSLVPAVKIVALLTILSIAPAILLMMTSFTRIMIVLGFVRQALGTQTMPANQVVVGLSLFLTFFTMSPIWNTINQNAITPYFDKQIDTDTALEEVIKPMRAFMFSETRETDLGMFLNALKMEKPNDKDDIPLSVLIPSFMISELKTAFQMGFLVYIPFLIIDMVVSSILMAMGMMMLPPTVVSLPFKLILFVLVDGWSLVVDSIIKSFNIIA